MPTRRNSTAKASSSSDRTRLLRARTDTAFRETLAARKHASTLQLLLRAARLVDEEALRRIALQAGAPRLRPSHTSLLPHIDLEGTRITVLAERRGISKQAVSQLVAELEEAGVLAREADPDDARAVRVVFTERGRRGLLEGLEVLRSLEAELGRALGASTMEHLRSALVGILGRLDDDDGAPL